MIAVTERAAEELQLFRALGDAPPDHGVKLVPETEGSIGLTIAPPDEGDEVIRHDEAPLLIVDRSLAGQLDGTVLDADRATPDAGQNWRFTVRPAAIPTRTPS
jgi:hypothetical protein